MVFLLYLSWACLLSPKGGLVFLLEALHPCETGLALPSKLYPLDLALVAFPPVVCNALST